MVDVERRLFVVPGEQPTEGVERKGVFGVETRAFPRLAQRLLPLEVAREGQEGTVLIPVVDEFLEGVDEQTRCIYVNVPQGLLDL